MSENTVQVSRHAFGLHVLLESRAAFEAAAALATNPRAHLPLVDLAADMLLQFWPDMETGGADAEIVKADTRQALRRLFEALVTMIPTGASPYVRAAGTAPPIMTTWRDFLVLPRCGASVQVQLSMETEASPYAYGRKWEVW